MTKSVVDELIKNPSLLKLGGEKRVMTALFSDIAGFTTISEAMDVEELVLFLNEYLTEMTDIVIAYKGFLDNIIMRFMDILLAFPHILLAIVIMAYLGPGLTNAMIAIGIIYIPRFARIVRASVLEECEKDYVTASRSVGARDWRIIFVAIFPNCLAPLIVQTTLGFASAILDAAALGFLGLGAQPPTPEWGAMIAMGRSHILRAWWVMTFPGIAILFAVLGFNLFGDGLRDALDPRLRD